jgi:large subunit ribosomal protein L17
VALRRNLIKQFFIHERIKTTRAKAAAIRGDAERLITLARNSAQASDAEKVYARRMAVAKLGDNQVNRNGGYTRVLKLGPRMGDSAEMVILELVEE